MIRVALALAVFACFVSTASAQIIFEPVQYQYDSNGTMYYYGGSDPYVHAMAHELYSPGGTFGRVNGFAFVSATRQVSNEPIRAYTDAMPRINGHLLGFTPDDARNEAYANAPRYFVKRDLLNAAVRQADGTWVVPAQAQPVRVYRASGVEVTPAPATSPKPLLIIPKDQLNKPNPKPSDKHLASAQ
jgi:hypothetical protein